MVADLPERVTSAIEDLEDDALRLATPRKASLMLEALFERERAQALRNPPAGRKRKPALGAPPVHGKLLKVTQERPLRRSKRLAELNQQRHDLEQAMHSLPSSCSLSQDR